MRIFHKKVILNLDGFTLIELLISMVIFLMIMAMVYTIFRGSLNYWQRGYATTSRQQAARLVFKRMTEDISGLFMSVPRNIYCQGTADKFNFIKTSGQQEAELSEVGYAYNSEQQSIVFSYQAKADYDFDTYDYKSTIAVGVLGFNLSYLDSQGEWLDSWDSSLGGAQEYRAPQAVKVFFQVRNEVIAEKKENFETIIELPIRTKYL